MDASVSPLVERTISDTQKLIDRGAVSWSVARRGIILIIRELTSKHPDCQQEIKRAFEKFIVKQDALNRIDELSGLKVVVIEQIDSNGSSKMIQVRRHERFITKAAEETLNFGRHVYHARILNVSKSGIGLETSIRPPIGATILVAGLAVTVVRHFETGFAGTFDKPIELEALMKSLNCGH